MLKHNLIHLKLLAKTDAPFTGYELQQALAIAGFEFASADVLHHYGAGENRQRPLFSVTSAKEPKLFDLLHIGLWSCSGLIFFMQMTPDLDNKEALNCMLESANMLHDILGGSLLDDNEQPLTQETINRWQLTIKNFTLQQQSDSLFAAEDVPHD